MSEIRRPETEEERRERVRRARSRKELQRQRMRRKKIIRAAVCVLIGALGLLLILAVLAIVNKVRDDRAEQAVEEELQEEISNSEFYGPAQVLHLSFPVLTLDNAGSGLSVSQFRLILEDLYAQGYVLIDPYDLITRTEKGYVAAQIMVPSGKKPLILSQRDVSYEAGDTAHATALTKDASGRIRCTYYDEYGALVTGAEDVIPIVEEFIETHPDFSYKGARGILGVTGYRGLLGYTIREEESIGQTIRIENTGEEDANGLYGEEGSYDGDDTGDFYDDDDDDTYGTDEMYTDADEDLYGDTQEAGDGTDGSEETTSEADSDAADGDSEDALSIEEKKEAEEALAANRETAEDIAKTLRADGWRIASNTYAVLSYAGSAELVQEDAEQWNEEIAPLVGATDMLMLPEGADIGKWSGYTDDDARYTLLRDMGFRYFFVGNEETTYWAQVRPAYVRQGMHEITEYASYLSLLNESAEATSYGDELIAENVQTNGTLELVGEALQPEEVLP